MESINRKPLNVLGGPLEVCGCNPMTGWTRDGYCSADIADNGKHIVCCIMTKAFLTYSKAQGNDLSTPIPEYGFVGLKPGEKWCLCLSRWLQAYDDCMAPYINLEATDIRTTKFIALDILKKYKHIE